jgi:hypothetical protein
MNTLLADNVCGDITAFGVCDFACSVVFDPLDRDLDVKTYKITTTTVDGPIVIAPNGIGAVQLQAGGGRGAHAVDLQTGGGLASGAYSAVVGGISNTASGCASYAEGISTTSSCCGSHSEGCGTTACGCYSHAGGC